MLQLLCLTLNLRFAPSSLVIMTTMGSADSFTSFSPHHCVNSLPTDLKASPGNAPTPSHLCLPHLHCSLPCKYWALAVHDTLPSYNASYEVPVCQASVLPKASFRHPLASLPLPSANASPYRVHRGLSPPSVCAMPGAHKKTPRRSEGFR